jgi:hypothetical protein
VRASGLPRMQRAASVEMRGSFAIDTAGQEPVWALVLVVFTAHSLARKWPGSRVLVGTVLLLWAVAVV